MAALLLLLLVGLLVPVGCAFDAGAGPADSLVELSTSDGAALDRVSPASRLLLTGPLDVPVADIWLVEGAVSSVSASRMRRGEVTQTVEDARVELAVWRHGEAVELAPLRPMAPGTVHTVVAVGVGEIATFETEDQNVDVLYGRNLRGLRPGGVAVYCAREERWSLLPVPIAPGLANVEPGLSWGPTGAQVEPWSSFDDLVSALGCVFLQVPEQSVGPLVPPAEAAGRALSGVVEILGDDSDVEATDMAEDVPIASDVVANARLKGPNVELSLGAGFVAAIVRSASGQGLALVHQRSEPGEVLLGPLEAGRHELEVLAVSPEGQPSRATGAVSVDESSGALVISEVLANPRGPEPASEWVELQNVGSAAVSLRGYVLEDSGGSVDLPPVSLGPGRFGLVVTEDYVPAPELDVVPDAATVPIVVPNLGASGLLNSGELVRLFDPSGEVVSEVPPLATSSGISWARRHPLAPDQPEFFGEHSEPGASPGKANVLGE